jgi:ArsR family metal-binding transcriptional regulator
MLLESYDLEIFNSKCNPGAMSVHCFAHLAQDVSDVLPYLNTVLGGFEYTKAPPSVTFKSQGKLITVHGRKIAVNALKDEAEARKIIEWLKREINDAWDRRDQIEPSDHAVPRPKLFDILKLLPKTNCKACGEPTCMVFAARAAEGVKDSSNCPALSPEAVSRLDIYLGQFHFIDADI